ncbi:hypothetical protein J1N35_021560 [Gossypium stocksii]|uniref:RNase H type-1 domain-containing protein n=1 Tax=Gossypium stocksii TaxID=47602 RepID=A0A9D3VGY9_9ROSI|nr:hypothetical protein J1N35_021560 [Gossypium stocksii]
MNWLKEGDKNTKFFHTFASQRKRVNRIEELENGRGQLVIDKKEMADVVKECFQELFSSRGISNPKYILSGIESCISEAMNALLIQKYWHIVGEEKTEEWALRASSALLFKSTSGYKSTSGREAVQNKLLLAEIFSFSEVLLKIWTARNKWIHEKQMQKSDKLTQFILTYLRELDGICKQLPVNKLMKENWRPSEENYVKINFDAAYDKQQKKSCTGIVIRNLRGQVLKIKVHFNKHIPSAFVSEVLACVQAVQFGAELGFLRSDIKGDALSVIKKINNEEEDRSEIMAYIVDAKRLKNYFISCRFKHAGIQMNKVAHLLAKKGINMEEDTYLRNELPSSVTQAVEEINAMEEEQNRRVQVGDKESSTMIKIGIPIFESLEDWGKEMVFDSDNIWLNLLTYQSN